MLFSQLPRLVLPAFSLAGVWCDAAELPGSVRGSLVLSV